MGFITVEEAFAVPPLPKGGDTGEVASAVERQVAPAVQAERDRLAGSTLMTQYASVEDAQAAADKIRAAIPKAPGDQKGILTGHLARLEMGIAQGKPTAAAPAKDTSKGNFITFEEAAGAPPNPTTWEKAKAIFFGGAGELSGLREQATAGLSQVNKEVKAATNMLVGMPGGIAGVGMDAMSRLSSLFQGDSPKVAGQKARMVAEQVNEDWGKVTKALGLSQDASGSKIDQLMNWAMEASDKGGATLEQATKGVLSLETTQSVRDTLLNALGVKGMKMVKPGANPTASALTPEAAAKGGPAASKPLDTYAPLIETPIEPPTKADVKANKEAVDSLVVDKTRLKEIFGIAKAAGAEAEAALVKNIFDRVLQPIERTRVEPPAAREPGQFGPEPLQGPPAPPPRPAVLAAIEKKGRGELLNSEEAKALRQGEIDVQQLTPVIGSAMEKLRDGKLISAVEAKALRRLDVDVAGGVIKGPNGQVLFERGQADPRLLGVLTAMGVTALAAPHIVDWWNNSGGLSGDNSRDLAMGLGALGAFGMLKGEPTAKVVEARPFQTMPLKEVIETYRTATGRSKELAAAKIYEDTHRQLTRSVANMGKDLQVDDIVQQAYMKAFQALDKPADAPGGYRGDIAAFPTFLHGVAKNEMRQIYRTPAEATARRTGSMEVDPETGGAIVPEKYMMDQAPEKYKSAYDEVAQTEMGKAMQAAIDKLPEDQQAVFKAAEIEGMPQQEIADMLGVPLGTVKSRLSRANESLRHSLRSYKDLQAGKVDQSMLTGLATISGGAMLGMLLDPEKDVRSAAYGALAGGLLGTGAGRGALKAAIKSPDAALGLISTRLGNIAPELKFRLRDHALRVFKGIDAANDAVLPFIQTLDKLPGDLQAKAASALLNGDVQTISTIPGLSATYPAVQKLLGTIKGELQALNRFGEGISDYFPRIVKDFEGLKAAMGAEVKVGLEKMLMEAEAKMIRKKGRSLTDVEESILVNRYLFSADQTSFQPGFAKSRMMREVPENLQQFYEPPTQSLLRYITGAINDIETAKFFGKDLATKGKNGKIFNDVDSSIGNITARLIKDGRITQPQAMQVRDMLKARFEGGEKGMNTALGDVRNLTNAGLLGNITSAATQLGDSGMTIYHHGLVPTLQALTEKLIGRERVTPKDLGLVNHIAEELSDMGWSGAFLHATMKYSGFQAIDMFAKGLGINAALIKNQKMLRTPKGQAQFRAKYQSAFENVDQVMEDLRAGKRTVDTDLLAFNELSDTQPVSRAEMPEIYLAHPNGRILYQLKTYMLKQLDIVRRDAYQEIASGTPEGIMRGTKNLAALATAYALSNIPGDIVKDWLSGRDVDLFKTPDLTENVLKTFGLNRYATDKLKSGKITETVAGMMIPPTKVLEDVVKLDETAVQYIPFGGRVVSDRYFNGNERKEIANTRYENRGLDKRDKKPLSPAAKQYLKDKRLKDKQKQLAR